MNRSAKVLQDALRIGALICLALATIMFMTLLGGSFSEPELVVSQKSTSGSGLNTRFGISCELPFPQRGATYNLGVSRTFYDTARTGDSLRSPLVGYLKLVRNGEVLARHFSQDFIVPAAYSAIALLPLLSFLRLRNILAKRIALPFLVTVELAVIGVFLYGTFVPCC